MTEPPAKSPEESRVEMREIVLPNDTNTHGNVLGGKVLHLMDVAAAMAAIRHCRKPVVTATMDKVEFLHPIPMGHFIILKAMVNYTGRTSLEVGVRVDSEHPLTGEIHHTSSAYLTFVALGDDGKPVPVPPLGPRTPEERKRYQQGEKRMNERRKHRHAD